MEMRAINWLYRHKYYFERGSFVLMYINFAFWTWGIAKLLGLPKWFAPVIVLFGFASVWFAGWLIVERFRGPQRDEEEALKRSEAYKMYQRMDRRLSELHEAQFGKLP